MECLVVLCETLKRGGKKRKKSTTAPVWFEATPPLTRSHQHCGELEEPQRSVFSAEQHDNTFQRPAHLQFVFQCLPSSQSLRWCPRRTSATCRDKKTTAVNFLRKQIFEITITEIRRSIKRANPRTELWLVLK